LKNIQGFQRDILRLFPGRTGNDPAKKKAPAKKPASKAE